MIVSHKHKFVFIHNPKVAGSSIRDVLESYHDHAYKFWQHKFIPELDRVADLAHLTLSEISLLFPKLAGYTFFTLVRNPEARLLSSVCEYKKQHLKQKTLDPFLLDNLTTTSIRFDWKYTHFCPQHYYFANSRHNSTFFKNLKVFAVEDLDTKVLPFIENLLGERLEVSSLSYYNKAEKTFKEEVARTLNQHSFQSALHRLYLADTLLLKETYDTKVSKDLYKSLQTREDSDSTAINRKCSPFEYFNSETEGVYQTSYLKEHLSVNKVWNTNKDTTIC